MAGGERNAIGLMSGTSADGVDAVACAVRGRGLGMRVRILSHVHRPYPAAVRAAILSLAGGQAASATGFCRLNWTLGEIYAETARRAIDAARLRSGAIAAIGLHGQTICHLPPRTPRRRGAANRAADASRKDALSVDAQGRHAVSGTWQIGEPAVVAARLGVPVVARFREADVAAGGQGAPLVPWTDLVLFRDRRRTRAIQNLGGIANVTWLPAGAGPDDVIAFDSGPANMVIDALAERVSGGRLRYDRAGRRAARGRVHESLLNVWLAHPYFGRPPPKSCGREEFGAAFLEALPDRYARQLRPEDLLATATMLTARTIADALGRWLPARRGAPPVDEMILCGGGARNDTLRRMLAALLPHTRIDAIEAYGIPTQAKEALSFALLACACVDGVPANLPRVTGARRPVILGQIVPASAQARASFRVAPKARASSRAATVRER